MNIEVSGLALRERGESVLPWLIVERQSHGGQTAGEDAVEKPASRGVVAFTAVAQQVEVEHTGEASRLAGRDRGGLLLVRRSATST